MEAPYRRGYETMNFRQIAPAGLRSANKDGSKNYSHSYSHKIYVFVWCAVRSVVLAWPVGPLESV